MSGHVSGHVIGLVTMTLQLFLFNNIIDHLVFALDTFWVDDINKTSEGQQEFLQNRWYINNKKTFIKQKMTFLKPEITLDILLLFIQKKIQMV